MVRISSHRAIKVKTGVAVCHEGAIDGYLVKINADAMILSIAVEEHAELEERVWTVLDTWHHAAGRKGGLFDIAMEILRVLIEDEATEFVHLSSSAWSIAIMYM